MYSRQSRKRFLEFIATIDWEVLPPPLFITLTFPDQVLGKKHQDHNVLRWSFHRHFERAIGKEFPIIWRREWQDRKSGANKKKFAPHFHLLCFTQYAFSRKEVRAIWAHMLQHKGALATDVRRCDSAEQSAVYLAKYLGKAYDPHFALDNSTHLSRIGRSWGCHRIELMPRLPKILMPLLSDPDWQRLRKMAEAELPEYMGKPEGSFTLIGDAATRFVEKAKKNGLHEGEVEV